MHDMTGSVVAVIEARKRGVSILESGSGLCQENGMQANDQDPSGLTDTETSSGLPESGDRSAQVKRAQGSQGHRLMNSLKKVHVPAIDNPRATSIYLAIGEVTLTGDYAEFGVYSGGSARLIHALMFGNRKLHLFDSFEGLPEDWTDSKKAGSFKLPPEEIPNFNPRRTVVHKGWFKDTVPEWAKTMTGSLAFVHMDADLYSSSIDVLFNIDKLVTRGTILLFDEYVFGPEDGEHRALTEWAKTNNRKFEYLWRTSGPQVCIRVTV
jgi:hypothetical protein